MRRCDELENGSLVSMETKKEWQFVLNLTEREKNQRWFIGLESVNGSHTWCWLNKSIACVNETSPGAWRWNEGEPNNHEKGELCVEMLKNGKYNNIACQKENYDGNPGYICEKQVNCSTVSQLDDIFKEKTKEPSSTRQLLATKTTATSLRTKMRTAKTEDRHEMLSKDRHLEGVESLAAFTRLRSPSDNLQDRVTCTYEVPPSSRLQSIDPLHVQQAQSSTQLTVHLTLSQSESGLGPYETVSDCKKESEYDDIIESNEESRAGSEGCTEIHEQDRKKAMKVDGKEGIEQPPALCNEKDENRDNVYAVVHKERKGKVSSKVSALKTSPGRPQEGASGLPVNQATGVDCSGRSAYQIDSGLDKKRKAAESEKPQAGGNNDYLYAAVDMRTKKNKPPQKTCFVLFRLQRCLI
ncbi:Hepatic lectin [Stylophora pistillata]|uniref:Hepatic lectin n=1 Tax=Stylophora pistillata TaxID=50429 RepID=A0A2B4RJU8_STYPI|nr:Hepatic lectin [Stylophora pistillata]